MRFSSFAKFLILLVTCGVMSAVHSWMAWQQTLLCTTTHEHRSTYHGLNREIRACSQNPFLSSLKTSDVVQRMENWQRNVESLFARVQPGYVPRKMLDHSMFYPFDPFITCQQDEKVCVGGNSDRDGHKIVCGLEKLSSSPVVWKEGNQEHKSCVIYSIGSNNQWSFELDLLNRTNCEIHTFDCTGHARRFKKPHHARLHFHHVCLGHQHEESDASCDPTKQPKCGETWTLFEMQQRLQHKRIDLLKIDVEGFEWSVFESWPELSNAYDSQNILLPMQICVEIHLWATHPTPQHPAAIIMLQSHLNKMGYAVVARNDNPECPFCTELTLIRVEYPSSGVYTPPR